MSETYRTNPDFIKAYTDYADILEAPRTMHEAVATQLVAAVLNANGVLIPHGGLTYPLDCWMLLLSGSGMGRSTLVGLAEPILRAAGLSPRAPDWGSAQALYQQMSTRQAHFFVWGEMSEKLKTLNDPRFGGVKVWLTDRYDNLTPPGDVEYRSTGRGQMDTPPIRFTAAPRTNILATSSEDWFFKHLQQEDSMGGFMPRWMFVRADGPVKCVPTPHKPDEKKAGELAQALRAISALSGEADISKILPLYEAWYPDTQQRFLQQPQRQLAEAYFNRHRVHVLKLAVIYEVSQSLSLVVSPEAWARAVKTARQLEETIFSLLPTGMSLIGHEIAKIESRIREAGSKGLSKSELTRAFQHMRPQDRKGHLETLISGGRVVYHSVETQGRPAIFYVHINFNEAYQRQHPSTAKAA